MDARIVSEVAGAVLNPFDAVLPSTNKRLKFFLQRHDSVDRSADQETSSYGFIFRHSLITQLALIAFTLICFSFLCLLLDFPKITIVAIAQTVLKLEDLPIPDETTSAFDEQAHRAVRNGLKEEFAVRRFIPVLHQAGLAINFDRGPFRAVGGSGKKQHIGAARQRFSDVLAKSQPT